MRLCVGNSIVIIVGTTQGNDVLQVDSRPEYLPSLAAKPIDDPRQDRDKMMGFASLYPSYVLVTGCRCQIGVGGFGKFLRIELAKAARRTTSRVPAAASPQPSSREENRVHFSPPDHRPARGIHGQLSAGRPAWKLASRGSIERRAATQGFRSSGRRDQG